MKDLGFSLWESVTEPARRDDDIDNGEIWKPGKFGDFFFSKYFDIPPLVYA